MECYSAAQPNLRCAEDLVQLLRHAHEGRAFGKLLERACAHIGAGGTDAAQNILERVFVG